VRNIAHATDRTIRKHDKKRTERNRLRGNIHI
jgi:hypothetical protein